MQQFNFAHSFSVRISTLQHIANVYSSQNVLCLGLWKPVYYVFGYFHFFSLLCMLDFIRYFVAKICETFSWGAQQSNRTREKKKENTDLRCTQLKCGESFSNNTHTHIFKMEPLLPVFFLLWPLLPFHWKLQFDRII